MKYLFLLLLAFALGCNATKTEVKDGSLHIEGYPELHSYKVREFEYKGCEYLAIGSGHSLTVTHKGNCKYCQQRNK